MKVYYNLSAAIIGVAATLTIVQPQVLAASSAENLRRIAREITVQISEVQCSNTCKDVPKGSGAIVAKSGDTYYLVTAEHVVRDRQAQYKVVAPDGSSYAADSNKIFRVAGGDLAVVPFVSNNTYTIATLSSVCIAPSQNPRASQPGQSLRTAFCQRQSPTTPQVLVAGYPVAVVERQLNLTFGSLIEEEPKSLLVSIPFNSEYELVYTNETQRGMNGGPILDSSGRVVGIHGVAEKDFEQSLFYYGYGFGTSIDPILQQVREIFLNHFGLTLQDLQIEASNFYPQELTERDISSLLGGKVAACDLQKFPSERQLVELSDRFYRLGRNQEALDCLEKSLTLRQNSPLALYLNGFLLSRTGQLEAGLKFLERGAQSAPDTYIFWRWHGVILNALGRYEEALQSFDRAIDSYKGGSYYQAWEGKAEALDKLGRTEESLAAQNIVGSNRSSYASLVREGNGLFKLERYPEALDSYENAIKLANEQQLNSAEAWLGKGRVLVQQQQYEAALASFSEAGKLAQATQNSEIISESWFEQGRGLSQLGRFQDALKSYQLAVEANPNHERAWLARGLLQYELKEYAAALASFQEAVRIKPDFQLAVEQRDIAQDVVNDIQALEGMCEARLAREGTSIDEQGMVAPVLLPNSSPTEQGESTNNNESDLPKVGETVERLSVLPGRVRAPSGSSAFCLVSRTTIKLQDFQPDTDPQTTFEPSPVLMSWLLDRGYTAEQEGNYAAVENIGRQIIELDAKETEAYIFLGNALQGQGRMDEAIGVLQRAIELDPQNALAFSNLGGALANQGQLEEAKLILNRAIQLNAKDDMAYNNLGAVLIGQGQWQQAEAALQRAIELNPQNTKAYFNLGILLSEQNRLAEAQAILQRGINLEPNEAKIYSHLGTVLIRLGQLDEGMAAIQRAIALDPNNPKTYFSLGLALSYQNRIEESLSAYKKAIDLNPNYAAAYNNLGSVLERQGRWEESRQAYQKAVEINPNQATAHNNLGRVLMGLGQLVEAQSAYQRAIALDPNYAAAYANLGYNLFKQQQLEAAEAVLQQAIALDPNDPVAYYHLGVVWENRQKLLEAATAYQRAIALDPNHAASLNNLGGILMAYGRFGEAQVAYQRAIAIDSTNAFAYFNLGLVLSRLNRPLEAIAVYQKGIELEPNQAVVYNDLGRLLQSQGRLAEAIVVYRKAVELEPGNATYQITLRQAEQVLNWISP
ncbi:MAG TPA: hypothetical protein DDZ80_06520 [Cyanobacteria bacterium UBA8803]|nr:hypothetical protein [Cyanobacteria bacterium UBA8803]